MKQFLVIFLFLMMAGLVSSQISFGGKPYMIHKNDNSLQSSLMEMPVSQVVRSEGSGNKIGGFHFAHPFFVNYTPTNSGYWTVSDDGRRVWQLVIRSRGAYSLNLIFDHFTIPQSGKLFIYNQDSTQIEGAFTQKSHVGEGPFATVPIKGDEVIVEYSQDSTDINEPILSINAVNHDYANVFGESLLKAGNFGDSGECNVNMTCVSDYDDIERSVCKLVIDGTELCSGTLLNNGNNDGTPYIITAYHSLKSEYTSHAFVAWFNYEVPNCNSTIEGLKTQTISGAQIVAQASDLDMLLVRFNQMPPATYRPYWAGWTLTESPVSPVVCIHHPMGDVKKFSESFSQVSQVSFTAEDFLPNSHWAVRQWDRGTTEKGSSGAGLFDNNSRLIGTLSGGSAACGNQLSDYFSMIKKSWNYYSTANAQLKTWLDPQNQALTKLDGFDYYGDHAHQRLSNALDADSAVYEMDGVRWMGNNNEDIDAVAENFSQIESATVNGIYLMTGISSSSGTCRVKLWSEKLFSQDQDPVVDTVINLSALKAKAENLILLNNPVQVYNPVSVSLELPVSANFALYWQYAKGRKGNSAFLRQSGFWYPFPDIQANRDSTSAYIDLLISEASLKVDTVEYEDVEGRIVVYRPVHSSNVYYKWGIDYLKQVEVFDILGHKIFTRMYQPYLAYSEDFILMNDFSGGFYLFKFSFVNFTNTVKVVVP